MNFDFDVKIYEKLIPPQEQIEKVKKDFEKLLPKKQQIDDVNKLFSRPNTEEVIKPTENRIIFYLFSRSVPKKTVENVFRSSLKYKDIKFYGVLVGIDKETIKYLYSLKSFRSGNVVVKINPLIYEKVGAKVVPAFVFAKCREIDGIVRTNNCKFEAVLYGDVSLDYAVRKFTEEKGW